MSRRALAETVRNLDVTGPVSRALTQSPSSSSGTTSPRDVTFFDLFRRSTAPGTSSIFPSAFWERDLLQMAHSEPAIWHATVALGMLHQRWEAIFQNQDGKALGQRATAHYGKAMALAKDLNAPEKFVTLSLALVASANMLERWAEMQTHVMAGLRIVTHDRGASPTLRQLEATLRRVDLQAMTFSESSSPYPYAQVASIASADSFLRGPPVTIQSYEDAISELFGLWRSQFLLEEGNLTGQPLHGPWLTRAGAYVARLVDWERCMADFERGVRPDAALHTTRVAVRLYHAVLRARMQATPYGREDRHDGLLGHFEYILRLAATLNDGLRRGPGASLTLEPGLVIPLWMVSHKCRHPALRRASLRLLAETRSQEGMWRSDIVACVMQRITAIEEGGFPSPLTGYYRPAVFEPWELDVPWHMWARPDFQPPATVSWAGFPVIPEAWRVKDILGITRFHEGGVDLRLMMCSADDEQPYGPVRDVTIAF